jgi:hypothetical protein
MKLLTEQEIATVNGGNPIAIGLALATAAYSVAAAGFTAGWKFAAYLDKQ